MSNYSTKNGVFAYPLAQIGSYTYSPTSSILGKTKNSTVYLGYHSITEQKVAIKVLSLDDKKKQQKSMFKQEIQMLTLFKNCDKVIQVYDVYQTNNHLYIIMEVCDGDLQNSLRISLQSGFPEIQAKQIMNQILAGYRQIYQKKIIHRDLKTANVFLKDGKIKLADFGYAIKADTSKKNGVRLVKDNAGSPYYMSSQALTKNIFSYKSDIWSLGIIFYQMLTGKMPWKALNQAELIRQLKGFDIRTVMPEGISEESKQFLIKTLSLPINLRMDAQELACFKFCTEQGNNKKMIQIQAQKQNCSKVFSLGNLKYASKVYAEKNDPEEKNFSFKASEITNLKQLKPKSPIKFHKKIVDDFPFYDISFKKNLSEVQKTEAVTHKKKFQFQILRVESQQQN